jgi:uncharacterized membrane protein
MIGIDKNKLRRFFITGFVALLPTILTVVVLVWCYRWLHLRFGVAIQNWLHGTDLWQYLLTPALGTEGTPRYGLFQHLLLFVDPILGDILAILLFLVVAMIGGFLVATYLGRRIIAWLDRKLSDIPIVKQIYPFLKGIVEFAMTNPEKELTPRQVVIVEYPRKGIYSMGLITGEEFARPPGISEEFVTVFIPSSPTPVTGYAIQLPRSEVQTVDVSIEDAIRYCVSMGVVTPTRKGSSDKDKDGR